MASYDDYDQQLEQFDADCDTALYYFQVEPQLRQDDKGEAAK